MEQLEKTPTKERILHEALKLFSVKGYETVTVAEIAEAVGIKAPSLYKHYKSKQDIFDAILVEMRGRYAKYASSLSIRSEPGNSQNAEFYMNISEDKLVDITISVFSFFLHDEYTQMFRKMLTVEQYDNSEVAHMYVKQYYDDKIDSYGAMFSVFVGAGFLKPEDTQIIALHYYAPLFFLLMLCDCQPEREPEAVEIIEKHIRQFNRLYKQSGV